MDSDNRFPTSAEFQYISRKKKRKSRPNIILNSENSDDPDTIVEPISNDLDEANSNQTNEDDVQNTNEDANEDTSHLDDSDAIYVDGQLQAQPQITQYEVCENTKLEEVELTINKNALEDIPSLYSGEAEEYNIRALTKHAETYELEKFEKKALIIFNQDKIDGYKPRQGTEKDVEALKNTFERFDFEVMEHKDLTKKEIFDTLGAYFTQDFTDYGCVGIAILTHGSNSGLLRAKDENYSETEIINYFEVHDKPSLVTKPKFLILQACRGTRNIRGVPVHQACRIRTDSSIEPYILPAEADLLILHSSYVGSPSHRDKTEGSWFIQSLCDKINRLAATHDLESIIIEVKREVAIDRGHEYYSRVTSEMEINKQMPVMTSTLIRKLYLKKFGDPLVLPLLTVPDGVTCNCCKQGSNQVLDNVPSTPMLVQFGPCSCFLEHFDYMKNCFKYFTEEYPDDEIARSFHDMAETLEDGVNFNAAKERLAKIMCRYLNENAKNCGYYKYLYFYKH